MNPQLQRRLTRAALVWLVSATTYLAAEAIAARGYPGYSYAANFVSDLGVPYHGVFLGRELNSTLAPVMNYGGFILHGILFALAGWIALPALQPTAPTRRLLVGILIFYVAGSLLLGLVPGGNREAAGGLFPLHVLGAALCILGGNLAVVVLARHLQRYVASPVYSGVTIALLVCALLGVSLLLAWPHTPLSGVFERGCVYPIMAWELLTAGYLLARAPARNACRTRAAWPCDPARPSDAQGRRLEAAATEPKLGATIILMNPEVQRLQARAEECHRELSLEYFNAFAGLQDELDTTAIQARYPELADESTWSFIRGLGGDAVADAREHRFLRLAFSGMYSEARYRELNERIANTEGDATVEFEGAQIPFRALPGRISNEPDYAKRGELDAKHIAVIAALNPLHAQLAELIAATVRQLGFASTPAMVAELKGLDPPRFAQSARAFLDRSDAVYEERLAQYVHAAGIERGAMRHADMGYMLRAGRFDQLFPPTDMLPALARTLAGLGIDLAAQRNVTLDLETRPRKTPRAFCIAIDVPDDVRLVLSPRGGQDDYSVLFHEAGHLEFAAHTSPALPYIYKQHGDLSVHEGYAFLFQHLTASPVWWHEIMRAAPGNYQAFARFQRLYLFRRYCAKLNYELEFYAAGGGEQLADTYASYLSRAVGFPYPRERYLADFDADLYVLQYLQAWAWEVQLRRHLEQRFGEAWFTQRRAGDLLRELWSEGMKYNAEELAGQLGLDGLDIEPLAQELLA